MKLSVIIVNYNVEHFLEQCIDSALIAAKAIGTEIIVVDNNSVDGSLQMMAEKFPNIPLIANKDNVGFSKANNQGIRISKGEYILLLNPDTIVEADTFEKTVAFMDSHPEAGGLGVKMLDGKGRFLPESKRGLPTPQAAFYKMFGFSKIFPKSKRFASYHQGHLSNDEIHEVEILAGAFMLMRKSTLDKVGLLDEDFFMYGEDIDLSYRIILGGYKNYYFPDTRIIHYKGESTKKNTVNYVYVFYNAMVIFAKKHYSKENAKLFSLLINVAIILRAFVSVVASFFRKMVEPSIDFVLINTTLILTSKYWAEHFFGNSQQYPDLFLYLFIPLIVAFWQLVIYYAGGYEKPIKVFKILIGQIVGVMLVLVTYSLLPEAYRFSRAIILFGAIISPIIMITWRYLAYLLSFKSFKFGNLSAKRIAIVGSNKESTRVLNLMEKINIDASFASKVLIDSEINDKYTNNALGTVSQLDEIVGIHKIDELIFCAKDFSAAQIIDMMTGLKLPNMEYKIAPSESMFIIGSNSINTSSDIYFLEINAINKDVNKRFKRLFDIIFSLLLLIIFPFTFYIYKRIISTLKNLLQIVFGFKTFVGFDSIDSLHLPILKSSVLHPSNMVQNTENKEIERLNLAYARNYKVSADFYILVRNIRFLGN